ncbi:putative exosome complex subunit rrp46 protein [Lasiodiplodia theobromae]|uniref:Exosome complex component RRP46 n=1 Tax=Lasiodiplodia theobromae TaxID=45133 RepID=A0A5N5DUQ5_9PEZI|nr:Exosome complex subunit Rrp46 [Lasiodiplodia theobromae]KAB2581131.1 Exosome complex component RRP46 [Lasiodiplodia theobromae]KAF4539950.1 Exosome complex subunit Rrp46 [Lasiodiplodia theobromae]KAF9629436.1 putative exosome complex subunit rrp46 protein [Lasiodiplodia theobromae]
MSAPQASLSDLRRADGSATFSQNGYSVLCAVNGPLEVQRRDELPEEAAIEVNVRPASGVGSPKERHLETLIHNTLRHIILVRNHPRTLIQVTLQVLTVPEGDAADDRSRSSILSILPALLQASALALVSASIPLSTTFSATLLAVSSTNDIITNPSVKDLAQAASLHVFAFAPKGELLVAESEGKFDLGTWDKVHDAAAKTCCAPEQDGEGMEVDGKEHENLHSLVKDAVRQKVQRDQAWKEAP